MKTQIIAEIASSHNGDFDLLTKQVKAAATAGADIVKVQDWRAANVPDSDPDKERYKRYQFRDEWYKPFIEMCREFGVEPLTSIFNVDRVEHIASLGFKKCKIASVCLTNHDLLSRAGANFDEVILSTAMHSAEEIEEAADVLASSSKAFTLLACVANYPMRAYDAQINRMESLKQMLGDQEYASVGYSSHALDLDAPKLAIARGAKYLEVHFSQSRRLPQTPHQMYEGGPLVTTHAVSLEPQELSALAYWRDKVELMSGDGEFGSNHIEKGIKSRYLKRYGT